MKKINFTALPVQMDFEGETELINAAKPIANALRRSTADIGMIDFARTIYYSEGAISVSPEQEQFLQQAMTDLPVVAPVKLAILEQLQNDVEPQKIDVC